MKKFTIQIQPDGIRLAANEGERLTDVLKRAGLLIQLPCAGKGRCGKCGVHIRPAPPEPTDADRSHLDEHELEQGKRLACRVRIDRDMTVMVGDNLRVVRSQILAGGDVPLGALEPDIVKVYLDLPETSGVTGTSIISRIKAALGFAVDENLDMRMGMLSALGKIVRSADNRITAVLAGNTLLAVEPGDTTGTLYGMAFDVGTTTVVGSLYDLRTGEKVCHASRLNRQVVYGEDSISRIQYCLENVDGAAEMCDNILDTLNEIIDEASEAAGISPDDIYAAVFAGNTVMQHLVFELDTSGLAQLPFSPLTTEPVSTFADKIGLGVNLDAMVYSLPAVAGFVGGDTTAVMLACDYGNDTRLRCAVDVGTNGELALRTGDELLVCSTAAGPALEGAQLTCGMRAAEGAVERFRITDAGVELGVIGETAPRGLCGSGIIDTLAELLRVGVVDETGRLLDANELAGTPAAFLADRLAAIDDQPAFILTEGGEDGAQRLVLTQRDIRQVQLAKGAIRAGIESLLAIAGMSAGDLEEILLAGAFGNYIDRGHAVRIGLLPPLPVDRIRFVGNAASTGAVMALLSVGARNEAVYLARSARHIELAALPEFMDRLGQCMTFEGGFDADS